MKRSGFLKRKTPLRAKTGLKHYKKLCVAGHSDTADLKADIQALLRHIVILRDGGCFLRHFRHRIDPQYEECGPTRSDGLLVLQAEHLHSRANASAFSDSRLVVCCCQRHHIYYKAQHSAEYNELAREFIGPERSKLWDRVREDRRAYKVDLKLAKVALEAELRGLQKDKIDKT